MKRGGAVAALVLLTVAACGGDGGRDASPTTTSTTTARETSTTAVASTSGDDLYTDAASWLCRPDVDDACEDDVDATVIEADGTTSPDPFRPDAEAPVDCFYVYPTVSLDPDVNSDMVAGPEERNVARRQAARFESACTLYAPLYHQATLTALRRSLSGAGGGFFAAYQAAYDDVRAAWRHYLATDNHGRGVILIGHSQGSAHLQRLLREEIDPDPAQRALLVSAMLMGASVYESELPHIPPCRSNTQTGCIITYSTFRDTAPPPSDSYFARPTAGGESAICTNPASLAGGSGPLEGYYSSEGWGVDVSTPWVRIPDLVTSECRDVDGFNHLSITVHPDPGPRTDDVRGDLTPQWGMHVIDVSEALGDLVEIARAEGGAYRSG